MGKILAGLASSHAFTFMDPAVWPERRARNRSMYAKRYGVEPPNPPELESESMESIQKRYVGVRAALERLRSEIAAKQPSALLVIGDDQNENFTEENMPQFAIYTGSSVRPVGHDQPGIERRCHSELAEALLQGCVEQGIDLSYSRRFPNGELKAHAHGPPLEVLLQGLDIPIVLLFVNAIHVPAPEPSRCYALGQAIRHVVEGLPADQTVMVYGSGGLSHFTAGYPWAHYTGPYGYGQISLDFDRTLLTWMRSGETSKVKTLSSKDLIVNGDIEFRSWIIMLGAIGEMPATDLVYEPFYHANMAMGVGYWDLAGGRAA